MNHRQREAIVNHCRLSSECLLGTNWTVGSIGYILTVNSGYE